MTTAARRLPTADASTSPGDRRLRPAAPRRRASRSRPSAAAASPEPWSSVRPATIDELYWAGRVTLLSGHDQIEVYDRVFAQVFRGVVDVADARGDPNAPPPAPPRRPGPAGPATRRHDGRAPGRRRRRPATGTATAPGDGDEDEPRPSWPPPAPRSGSARRTSRRCDAGRAGVAASAHRRRCRSRRRRARAAGASATGAGERLDLRATLRRSHRTGGDPVERVQRRRQRRPPPARCCSPTSRARWSPTRGPTSTCCTARCGPRGRGLRVRHPPDAPHPRRSPCRDPDRGAATGGRRRRPTGRAARASAPRSRLQRRLRPAGHGPRRRRRDRVATAGSATTRRCSASRWPGWHGWPTASCGSTRAVAGASVRAAGRRDGAPRSPTSTRWSAATRWRPWPTVGSHRRSRTAQPRRPSSAGERHITLGRRPGRVGDPRRDPGRRARTSLGLPNPPVRRRRGRRARRAPHYHAPGRCRRAARRRRGARRRVRRRARRASPRRHGRSGSSPSTRSPAMLDELRTLPTAGWPSTRSTVAGPTSPPPSISPTWSSAATSPTTSPTSDRSFWRSPITPATGS